jgi:hypothetical protein
LVSRPNHFSGGPGNNLSGKEGFDNLVTQKRIDVVFDSASSLIGSISKQIYDDEIRINNEIFELQKDVLGLKFPKTVANTERNPYLEQRVNLLEKETKLQNREFARPSEFDIKFSQTFQELEKRVKSLETKLGWLETDVMVLKSRIR